MIKGDNEDEPTSVLQEYTYTHSQNDNLKAWLDGSSVLWERPQKKPPCPYLGFRLFVGEGCVAK